MLPHIYNNLQNIVNDITLQLISVTNSALSQPTEELHSEIKVAVSSIKDKLETNFSLDSSEIINNLDKFSSMIDMFFDKTLHDPHKLIQQLYTFNNSLPASVHVEQIDLSLVVIIKNEAKYLKEWLEFHKLVGVDHFYIYDNDSTDNIQELLAPYINQNIVTYIPWPGKVQQLAAYNNALSKYKYDTELMGFIDADEFLVPVQQDLLYPILKEILDAFPNAGGIGVNWRPFGCSYNDFPKDGLLIENYKYRTGDFGPMTRCIKTICKPTLAKGFFYNPHEIVYNDRHLTISENGSYIIGPWFYDGMCKKLRINHYFSKSRQEYIERLRKGKPDSLNIYSEEYIQDKLDHLKDYYEVKDDIMDRFIDKLKQNMQ